METKPAETKIKMTKVQVEPSTTKDEVPYKHDILSLGVS